MEKYIIKLKNKVLREKEISYEEALNLISLDTNNKNDFDILLKSANEIREYQNRFYYLYLIGYKW